MQTHKYSLFCIIIILLSVSVSSKIVPSPMDFGSGQTIVGDKTYYENQWAVLEVVPHTSFSLPKVLNFTQKLKLCNKAIDSGYFFIDYWFDNPLEQHYLSRVKEYDILENTTVFDIECNDVGIFPDNSTVCLPNGKNRTVGQWLWKREQYLLNSEYSDINTKSHYIVKKGEYLESNECSNYVLNFKPIDQNGKWNFRVWANIEDDWTCINNAKCAFDYVLDPTYTTNYTYKRNFQLNFTGNHPATNNVTVSFLLNLSNHNFNLTRPDGNDVLFTNFDETATLGCYKESFDNTTLGNFSLLITNFSNTTNTSVWMYYGNPSQSSNDNCAEINNAFILADLMNSSSINTSIWNQKVGTKWNPNSTNGIYQTRTDTPEGCGSGQVECYLIANTTGVLKQSQRYQVDWRVADKFPFSIGISCGWGFGFSRNFTANGIGTINYTFALNRESITRQFYIQNGTAFNTTVVPFTQGNFYRHRSFKINNNDPITIYHNLNSSGLTEEINLGTSIINASTLPNDFLNTSNRFYLNPWDGSSAAPCNQQGIWWDEVRVKAFINTTIAISNGSELFSVPSSSYINITNETYNTPVYSTGLTNFTVNVTWNANTINYVMANFTYESCSQLNNLIFCTPQNNTYVGGSIDNISGFVGSNIKWTNFNITIRPNMTNINLSNLSFQWNFTINTNVSNFDNNTAKTNQRLLIDTYVLNYTWTTPIVEGQVNSFILNMTRHVDNASAISRNVTIEYNNVNRSIGVLIANGTFGSYYFETYNVTMNAPFVATNTVFQHRVWLNVSFGTGSTGMMIEGTLSNQTQLVTDIVPTFTYKKNIQINSTKAYQAVNNYTVNVLLNLSNHDFNHTQNDGDDVAFYDFNEINLLGCYKESFDNTTMGNYSVLILNLSNATNTSIWVFYGNTSIENQCPEINNAFILADLMNSSSINSTIWNERQGSLWFPDTTNGSYKTITSTTDRCGYSSSTTMNCFLMANTTGLLKQSQTYQIDVRTKADSIATRCGINSMFSQNSSSDRIGSPNITFETQATFSGNNYLTINQNGTTLSSTNNAGSTSFIKSRMLKINNNDARTLYSIFNSSGIAGNEELNLGTARNASTAPNTFLNISNKFTLSAADDDATLGCVTTLVDEIRIRSFINSTLNYSFGTEQTTFVRDLIENNQTFETIGVIETGLANFSVNVTINGNLFNNISQVNFTWNNNVMAKDSQITNISIGNQTRFNISIRIPLAQINFSNFTFKWFFQLDSNATDDFENSTNYSQPVNWAYYINNQTYTSPLVSGRLNPITVNFTKHINTGQVIGLEINVTNEWNGTNRTAISLTNSSNYEEYNLTFRSPYVYTETNISMKGWLNITFNGSMVTRDPNFTQVLTPLSINATIIYEDPVLESGRTNFSANVTFNSADVNYVLANFTYDSGIAVYTNYITNTSGNTLGINWTFFNLTIRPNITLMNNSLKNFQWNFTIITNGTNLTNNTNVTTQHVLWAYWINNVTWTSPVFTLQPHIFSFNMTKLVDDATIFIRNVTLEYNRTNLTPNLTLVFNTTTYEIYNISLTAPSIIANQTVNWTAWINMSFQSLLSQRSNRTNTTIVNGTQQILAAVFNITYTGNVSNGTYNFVRNLTSRIITACSGNGTLLRNINNTLNASYPFVCSISGSTFNNSYIHPIEGNYTINWTLLANNITIGTSNNTPFISDLFNPIALLNVTSGLGFFNVSSAFNISLNCTDNMYSPLNYTKILNNATLFNGTLPNATLQVNQSNLANGTNIIVGVCADPFGSTISELNITLYLKSLALIDEINNTACDVSNLTGAKVYIDDNSTYFDYKFYNTSLINISTVNFTTINTTRLRFELKYSSGAIITRYIDVSLFNNTDQVRVCCNREGVTHFEQLITSAISRPVYLQSIFSKCFVAADYTRFVFQDRKVLKAFTIQQPYYLTTIINRGQVLLASLDGSIQTEINLDTLELIATPFDFSIIQSALSFRNGGANTTTILYNNSAGDNLNGTLVIRDITNNAVLFNMTMLNPNDWTLVFDYTTLNLSNSTMFQITYTATTTSGLVKTTKAYFTGRGANGIILNSVAAVISILLLLFGLSIASARITFAWLGIIICLAAFIILTLAAGGIWYITFLQAITAIVVIYIVINLAKQSGDTIT